MFLKHKYFFLAFILTAIVIYIVSNLISTDKEEVIKEDKIELTLADKLGFLNLNDTVKYVGINKCRTCHEDVYKDYMRTGMGKSWGIADTIKSASVFNKTLYDPVSDFYYKPYWEGNVMMVKEYRLDNADTIYMRNEKVDYVIGSGQHTNSHIKNINGYLYQVPFTYYTQDGLLDFPPGFEDGNNARFSRPIGFECINCHNSYPVPVKGSTNKYEEIPLGINCERCHGPGELHVIAMEKGEVVGPGEIDYTIIRPTYLPVDLQFELCASCHNQGNMVLKKGKSFFDFKPGMRVTDVFDVFREKYENDEEAFWMETHPERLKRSKCFSSTRDNPDFEPLTCLTCHFSPTQKHTSYKEVPADTFNSFCINCHNDFESTSCDEKIGERARYENNCIKCHMPKTGAFDIPHVVITDHHIRETTKYKEPITKTKDIEPGTFLGLKCMSNDNPDIYTWAKAYLYHFEKFYTIPSILDSAFYYLKKLDLEDNIEIRTHYYFLRGDNNKIVEISKTDQAKAINDPLTNYYFGQAYHNLGNIEKALKYYKIAVKGEPYNLDYRNKLGASYIALGNYQKAQLEFEFIIKENPKLAIAYNNLGFIYLLNKDLRNAYKYISEALKLDPDYLNAHLNMAKIIMIKGDIKEVDNYLQKLSKKFPDDPQIEQLLKLKEQFL